MYGIYRASVSESSLLLGKYELKNLMMKLYLEQHLGCKSNPIVEEKRLEWKLTKKIRDSNGVSDSGDSGYSRQLFCKRSSKTTSLGELKPEMIHSC